MSGTRHKSPSASESPLFEPETSPPPPYRSPSVPDLAAMVESRSTSIAPTEAAQVDVPALIQELRNAALGASFQLNTWALGSDALNGGLPLIPSKRKASDSDDDSDADSDEEDVDAVLPYDPSKQQRPNLPIFHGGFKLTEDLANHVLQTMLRFLKIAGEGGYHDKEVEILHREIVTTTKPPVEPAVRIAITGDTGSGKSATLNSILGVDNLTPEGDGGGAVTNVVTEFRKKLKKPGSPITAQVQFFCLEYCEDLVQKWFAHWHALENKEEDEIDDADRARKDAAYECLTALFADRVKGSLETFLAAGRPVKDDNVLQKLFAWTHDIHGKFVKNGETFVELGAIKHSEMREQLRPFRGNAQNANFKGKRLTISPWPFVEIILYYLTNAILEQGNCISDVPGSNDINVYRVATANEYLQKCEYTIVVGDMKRILSDASYRQHYMDAHRRRYHGSVILVITRSDVMNDDGGSSLELDAEAEEKLAPIEERLEALGTELVDIAEQMKRNKAEIKRAKRGEGAHEEDEAEPDTVNRSPEELKEANATLKARKDAIPSLRPPLEKQGREIRIACRNRQLAHALDMKYREDTGDDGGAMVFCVSNRMFMRHLRGYNRNNPDNAPTMSLAATQILELCRFIYGIPSQGKIAVLDNFVTYTIPALLDLVQMSCSKSTVARVDHVIKIVDRAITDLENQINALAAWCSETFAKELLDALLSKELQEKFDSHAIDKVTSWGKSSTLAAATHKALVTKNGRYTQKKKGGTKIEWDWNDELLSPVRNNIERAFRIVLDEACPTFQANAAQSIKKALMSLNQTLKGDSQALAGGAYEVCIKKSLKGHENNVTHQVERVSKKLYDDINVLKQKATGTDVDDYFYDAMIDIYEKSLEMKPSKKQTQTSVRQEYLRKHIAGDTGPFKVIAEFTKDDTAAIIEEIRKDLLTNVVKIFRKIRVMFHQQKTNKENDSQEGKQFRKDLHLLVEEGRKVMGGIVAESLERCKAHK